MAREFDDEIVEDAVEMLRDVMEGPAEAEDARQALLAAKEAIKELTQAALDVLESFGDRRMAERARGYWYAHIVGALDKDHGYCGGSMVTMEESANEVRESDEEEEE